ncbi:MAG: ABATE domain-containing protein [Gemmatimonadaceae bacterium]|nr:ABATE domain-containing protein [Gloeobacterales cyanobacterium ES-bin-141]
MAKLPPMSLADHPALDFLNTTASPRGERLDWLSDGEQLLDWLVCSGLLDAGTAHGFVADDGLDAVARSARELREWWRSFVARYAGQPLTPTDIHELEPLNNLLAQDSTFDHIEVNAAGAFVRTRQRLWSSSEQLLQTFAAAIADCLCEVDFTLVRRCENPECTLWFHDTTKSHRRRWCSMAVCGNRAKAAAHRSRSRRPAGTRT